MRRIIVSLLGLAMMATAHAGPLSIAAEPISDFQRLSDEQQFGPFAWRGGLTLTSPEPDFGGLSGLVLGKDCEDLLAVSDDGKWFRARLGYQGGKLARIADARLSPLLDANGKPLAGKEKADAEALARLANGELLVSFERLARFGRYRDTAAKFRAVPHPKDIDTGPENGLIEAAGELSDGRLLAISEGQFDEDGNIRAWAWKDWRTTAFTLAPFGDYSVTDLAVLEDGSVLTLERRFTPGSLPGMAVRRFDVSAIESGQTVRPEVLLEATAPFYVIDNMEGLALCTRDGETRVTLMSDDNFNRTIQSTILLQFAYRR